MARLFREATLNFGLRPILTALFMAVAAVPVLLLGLWVEISAYQRELGEVRERHLLIARNLTLALERYVTDAGAVLTMFGSMVEQDIAFDGLPELGRKLGFVYFCTLQRGGPATDHVVMDTARTVALTADQVALVWDLASEPGVRFSGVMPDVDGIPTIFVVQAIEGDRLVMGALEMNYVREMQESIVFGERGHSAIVDQFGRVIAHPSAEWVATSKDISVLAPVQRMMAGETDVMEFFSPAMQADMVAGYTFVPTTGWGVMVPQPLAELKEAADAVQTMTLILALIGLLVAGILSWLLAGLLMRPIADVNTAALKLADGDLAARAPQPGGLVPAELRTLAACFNQMAVEIEEDRRELAGALDEARIADRAKSEFLANVSHELRTPLNAIIGFSELIETQPFGKVGDPRYADYAENIRSSGEHLRDVINDILDLSAAQAADAPIDLVRVDPAVVIDAVLQIIRPQAEAGAITLVRDVGGDLGVVTSNARRLKQVLLNLLSNAVKFTRRGGRVTVSARRDEGAGRLVIAVSDTGIGMSPDDIPMALTPFGQLEASLTRRYEGTGLGLPLAKSFVERLGGSLAISSAPGEGTTVTVTLPLKAG